MSKSSLLTKMPKPTTTSDAEILQNLEPKDKALGRPAKYPRKDQEFTRLNIFIPKDIHKKFKLHSVESELSMNDLVIDAIIAQLDEADHAA